MITEKSGFLSETPCAKSYFVPQINRREKLFALKFAGLCVRMYHILIKERPDCVISTGALIAAPACFIAKKILHKKLIYIESFARIDELSMTGKMLYKMADLFVVQWEELAGRYPKAVYAGGLM
jgi:UDP-N-acetylglucosamine:LPS N-acetylglucosamine transferase